MVGRGLRQKINLSLTRQRHGWMRNVVAENIRTPTRHAQFQIDPRPILTRQRHGWMRNAAATNIPAPALMAATVGVALGQNSEILTEAAGGGCGRAGNY